MKAIKNLLLYGLIIDIFTFDTLPSVLSLFGLVSAPENKFSYILAIVPVLFVINRIAKHKNKKPADDVLDIEAADAQFFAEIERKESVC